MVYTKNILQELKNKCNGEEGGLYRYNIIIIVEEQCNDQFITVSALSLLVLSIIFILLPHSSGLVRGYIWVGY